MTADDDGKLEELEARLAADPSSQSVYEEILTDHLGRMAGDDPRRIHHIVEYVRRFPRTVIARCPLAHVHQESFPSAFAQVEHEWLKHQAEHPKDPDIARGLASFVAGHQPSRAIEILETATATNPEHADLWLDLGRTYPEPIRRLGAFQKARALQSSQPNLLTWIAHSAIEANDDAAAEQAGNELLALVAEARSVFGEKLDWKDKGRSLWSRARSVCNNEADSLELVDAVTSSANRKHWGHTVLGVLAVRGDDLPGAKQHLRDSVAVGSDYRLSSYGPSFLLARELCLRGEWDAVGEYLLACQSFWNPEPLRQWIEQVRHQQMPGFGAR